MAVLKRVQWTEAEVLELSTGEQDYFERKSGSDFTEERDNFLNFVAKALSAFANSGGGHLVLGLQDDAVTFDGLPAMKGRTPIRQWLEQAIPNLLRYELQDFRVHEVIPSKPSTIPGGKVAIVVDVGDSALAPHQTARGQVNYYFRQGGHSVIAPHHYLELFRQRVMGPTLTTKCTQIEAEPPYRTQVDNRIFLPLRLTFSIKNDGRIAAYKWALYAVSLLADTPANRYVYSKDAFPFEVGHKGPRTSSFKVSDPTLLPGLMRMQQASIGIYLHPEQEYLPSIHSEIERVVGTVVTYRVATETSPGEDLPVRLRDFLNTDEVATMVCEALKIE